MLNIEAIRRAVDSKYFGVRTRRLLASLQYPRLFTSFAFACCATVFLAAPRAHADFPMPRPDDMPDDVLCLSVRANIPSLTSAFAVAESYAASYSYDLAAEQYRSIFNLPEAKSHLDDEVRHRGTLRLCLESAVLFHLYKASRTSSDELARQCEYLVNKYAAKAAGKDWHAYELLFRPILTNAGRKKDVPLLVDTYERLLRYNPWDQDFAMLYMQTLIGEGRVTSNTIAILNSDGMPATHGAEFLLLKCKVLQIAGKDGLGELAAWFRLNPDCSMESLQDALEYGRGLMAKQPSAARLHRYCSALMNFALAQHDNRLQYVARVLLERSKLLGQAAAAGSNDVSTVKAAP